MIGIGVLFATVYLQFGQTYQSTTGVFQTAPYTTSYTGTVNVSYTIRGAGNLQPGKVVPIKKVTGASGAGVPAGGGTAIQIKTSI